MMMESVDGIFCLGSQAQGSPMTSITNNEKGFGATSGKGSQDKNLLVIVSLQLLPMVILRLAH